MKWAIYVFIGQIIETILGLEIKFLLSSTRVSTFLNTFFNRYFEQKVGIMCFTPYDKKGEFLSLKNVAASPKL